jgi:ABC-type polysaccharide/polyol phosphate export permease
MGQVSAEQTVAIIEAVGEAVKQPDPEPTNYWWLLIIAVIPVFIGAYFGRRNESK